MKVYYYTPAELGVEEFPPGLMRLGGFDVTENPNDADVWALQPIMHHFSKEKLLNLKYLPGREERHVVWDCADNFRTFGVPWIAIRCATTKHILKKDPTTIAWPWPVEPFPRLHVEAVLGYEPQEAYRHDVSFWGWRTPLSLTDRACESIGGFLRLRSLIWLNTFFFGHKTEADPDYGSLREGFVKSLWESRLALVPASIDGVIRYRLLEQVGMGRGLPVHICDNVVMPWAHKIEWDMIVPKLNVEWPEGFDHTGLSLPEAMVDQTGSLLVEWLAEHSDDYIKEAAWYGQEMYNTWLHRDKWDELFGIAVRERLEGRM